jgi:AcrR family transcriptional regulator
MQLFWEHGYEATGLSDIMAATGLGKASLYSAFGNKQSIFLKALAHYEKLVVDAAVLVLRGRNLPPLERIDAFLSFPITAVRDHKDRRGCFLCNAAADRASLDPDTARAIAASLSEAMPNLPVARIEARADVVLTIYSGMRVLSRSGVSGDFLMITKAEIMRSISQI